MYLLDTTVIPLLHPRRHVCSAALERWLEHNEDKLFLGAVALEEIETCILRLRRERKARRADRLEGMLEQMLADFGERILPVDGLTAMMAARLAEEALPRKVEARSLLMAATAKRHGLAVVTGVVKRYRGLSVEAVDAHGLGGG